MNKLELTEREAIIDYVFAHVRATNGLGKRVYEKMLEFLSGETSTDFDPQPHQSTLFT